jgi:hypothetical protein
MQGVVHREAKAGHLLAAAALVVLDKRQLPVERPAPVERPTSGWMATTMLGAVVAQAILRV